MLPEISLGGFIAMQLGGLALFVSLAVTGFASLGGLGDIPGHRSAHRRMTPTAGGLGVIAGVGAALLAAAVFHANVLFAAPGMRSRLATLLACTFAIGMLGLLDDRFTVPTRFKFGIMLALCFVSARAIGMVTQIPFGADHIYLLWWSGLIGTALWLFVVTNSANFIDGINGMLGLGFAVASGALCLLAVRAQAPVGALLSGTLCAALLGFLPYNLRAKAQVFCGDSGALVTGFVYSAAVLVMVREQPELRLLYAGPLLVLPVLVDVLLTLALKPFRKLPFTAPHSTHIFQRLARRVGAQIPVTLGYGAVFVSLALLVHHAFGRGTLGSAFGLGTVVGIFVCIYAVTHTNLPPATAPAPEGRTR